MADTVARRSARAILLDGGDLLLIRRAKPGQAPYWVTIGGGCEPEDGSLEDTLRRDVMEEAGAQIGPAAQCLVLTDVVGDGLVAVQHFFLTALVSLDPARRCGPELDQAEERGTYEVVRVPFTKEGLAAIDVRPAELSDFLRAHAPGPGPVIGDGGRAPADT